MKYRFFQRQHRFTLLEIIVAMAVFSILMAMILQFFSGAQRIWSSSEVRNNSYSDARVAMDLMATLLQSTYYNPSETPFSIVKESNASDKIYFAAKSPLRPRGKSNLFFSSFQRNDNNELVISTYCNEDDNFVDMFFPFSHPDYPDYNKVKNHVKEILNDHASQTTPSETSPTSRGTVVIPFVTGLSFRPAHIDYTAQNLTWEPDTAATYDYIPAAVEIRLTVLNQRDFERWQQLVKTGNSDAEKYRKTNEKTFSRVVYIGDRN